MGCFASKPARPLQCYTYKERPCVTNEITCDKTPYQGGLMAQASAATWQANGYHAMQYDIHMQPTYIFAASFAGLYGEAAAVYFAKHAFTEYQRALEHTPTNIATALTTTLQRLEARYLADAAIPAEVRARVGASATILIASIPGATCYVATVGAMQCVAVRAMGSFAAGWAEGRLLTQPHTISNDLERRRVHRNSDTHIPADVQSLDLTRILGMGALKHPPAGHPTAPLTAQPTVVRLPLTADVQQLVIASPGLGALASPTQCALCLHYYAQFCNHQEQLRQASERLGGVAVEQGTPVRVARDNVVMLPHERPAASFLVVRALGLLAESLRSRGVGGVEDVGDMQAMALACARNAGSLQHPNPNTRLALHNDLSAVVVQLQWPSHGSFHSVARSTLLAKQEVQRRWDLVRMWCDYRRARRRVILHAWWSAVAETLKAGKKRARMLEQKLWQEQNLTVEVSPTGKVKDLATGRVLDYTELSSQLIGSAAAGGGGGGAGHTRFTEP